MTCPNCTCPACVEERRQRVFSAWAFEALSEKMALVRSKPWRTGTVGHVLARADERRGMPAWDPGI